MERIEVKAAFTVDDAGTIEGIAWPWGSIDRAGDEIAPGAFAKAAAPLPMLDNHNHGAIIGIWETVRETAQGLMVKGRLLIEDIARAREIRAAVKAGAAQGLSVSFLPKKSSPRKGGGRTFTDLELLEVSIVAVPANPGARITTAKAADAEKGPKMDNQEQVAAPEIAALETEVKSLAETVKGFKAPDLSKIEERLAKVEAKAQRPATGTVDKEQASEIEVKALNTFLRGGIGALDDAERKALNLTTPTAGGYVVAPEYSTKLIEGITEISPIRQLAGVTSIGTTEIYYPVMTTPINGGWVTETGSRPEDQPVFDQINIKTFEHAIVVPVSTQLFEDSLIDLQAYLSGQIVRQFAKAENHAFARGDGNGKPTGFLNNPNLFEQVTAKQDGSDIIDKVIDLFYKLPSEYAARGSWLMTRELMGIIRKAADTTTKGTLWSDSLANGTPAMLLGRPVYEGVDMGGMSDGGSPEGPGFPVAFADWSSMYQIVDRIGVAIRFDDLTGADNGIVKLRARRRTGGKVVLPEAGVLLKTTESGE